ncbi:MAG: Ig-like domain-containing protein [Muribaculaceae bacterium]|nr:Ig-like domain-containing protein [Muribaculaceae bacterium]
MKKYLLSLFGVLMIGLISGAQANAVVVDNTKYNVESYTIDFKTVETESNSSLSQASAVLGQIIKEDQVYISSIPEFTALFAGKAGLRLSTSSKNGAVTFNLSDKGKVLASSVVVTAKAYDTNGTYDAAKMTVSVNGNQVGSETVVGQTLTDYTFDLTNLTNIESIRIASTNKRFYVNKITVNYVIAKEANGLSFSENSLSVFVGETSNGVAINNPNKLAVSYTSSDSSVATVDSTGKVTALKEGKTTITATTNGNDTYAGGSVSYTLTVLSKNQLPAELSFTDNTVTIAYDPSYTGQKLNNKNNLKVSYTSSNTNVATVSAGGLVTVMGVGTTQITASSEVQGDFGPGTASYTLVVTKAKVTLNWENGVSVMNVGDTFVAPTLKVTPAAASSSVVYNAEGLLSANNGVLTLQSGTDGVGRVTASVVSDLYEATPATYEVTVIDPSKIEDILTVRDFSGYGSGYVYGSATMTSATTGVSYAGRMINNNGNFQMNGDGVWITANPNNLTISKITFVYSSTLKSNCAITIYGAENAQQYLSDYTNNIAEIKRYNSDTNIESAYKVSGELKGLGFKTNNPLYLEKIIVQYDKATPEYSFDKEEYEAAIGEEFDSPVLKNVPAGIKITYSSSDHEVADVNGYGTVIIGNTVGTTTITASSEATGIYKSHAVSYVLNVKKFEQKANGLAFENKEVTTTYRSDYVGQKVANPYNLDVVYSSSNNNIATVNQDGVVSIVGVGTVTITAATEGNHDYRAGEASYTITVGKAPVNLTWSTATETINVGHIFTAPTLTVDPVEATEYVKLYTEGEVLSIVNGEWTIAEGIDGVATVTATIESDLYYAEPTDFVLNVEDPNKIEDLLKVTSFTGFGNSSSYTVATSASSTTKVTYSAQAINKDGDFQMNGDALWISANEMGLEISKITLVFASNTNNGNNITVYASDKVEASTADYTNRVAQFVKSDKVLEFTYRPTADYKSICLKSNAAVYIKEILVQYKKATPDFSFAKPEYEVHLGDESFVAPTLNNVPEGITVTYTSDNAEIATVDATTGSLQLNEEGTVTITAETTGNEFYTSYSTSYQLTVKAALPKNLVGDIAVAINDVRETIEAGAKINALVLDKFTFSALNADNIKVAIDGDEESVEGSSYDWTIKEPGEYEITVTASNADDSKSLTFTVTAEYDEAKVLGTFYVNGKEAAGEIQTNVNKEVVFTVKNAVEFNYTITDDFGSQTNAESANGSLTFTPKEAAHYFVTLTATDIYGVTNTTEFELNVVIPTVEILDFINNTYGMTVMMNASDPYNSNNQVLTGTSFTYTVNNRTRLWQNTGLRFNSGGTEESKGKLVVTAPAGYQIVSIETLNAAGVATNFTNIETSIAEDKITATVSFASLSGAGTSIPGLKVEVTEVPEVEGLTPSLDDVSVSKDADGNMSVTITTNPKYTGIQIYYRLLFNAKNSAARRVVSHEGYTLANSEGNTHTFTLPAGRVNVIDYYAYDPATDTMGEIEHNAHLYSNGSVTSIEEIEAGEESEGEVYDLQGRRIAKPTRGLFIQNGVKVLIRK